MLCYDLRSIAGKAAAVDGALGPDDPVWQDGDVRPSSGGISVSGRLSAAGSERYYFSGRIRGALDSTCRRCLKDVHAGVEERNIHLIFAEPGTEAAEDPDVFVLDPRSAELDLRPAVREQWLLAAPAYVVCREDCKGICSTCGADLNAGTCDCTPASADPRWNALRTLRGDPSVPDR